ncbi:MAG TPA: hypothetical protein VNN09_04065 [Candidatus Competibacteraceae bacterium]|nr:hypothetical protein [Candidatus Competibacteraceae bacterium]
MRHRLLTAAILALLGLAPAAQAAERITREELEAIDQSINRAANAENFLAIAPYLATEFVVRLKLADGTEIELGRPEYLQVLQQNQESIRDYHSNIEQVEYRVAPDGLSAEIHQHSADRAILKDGQVVTSRLRTMSHAVLREGRIVFDRGEGEVLEQHAQRTPGQAL